MSWKSSTSIVRAYPRSCPPLRGCDGSLSVRQARDLAIAEGVDEQPVVVAYDLGVVGAELHHLLEKLLFVAADGLGEIRPVEILDIGRELGDDEADFVYLGVAEPGVGMRLQRPLRDRRAVPV